MNTGRRLALEPAGKSTIETHEISAQHKCMSPTGSFIMYCYPEKNAVIEVDDAAMHSMPVQTTKDAVRAACPEEKNMRLASDGVIGKLEAVLD